MTIVALASDRVGVMLATAEPLTPVADLRRSLGRNLVFGLADVLGQAIVTGAYPLGAALTEAELSVRYGVSRTVTREALTMLAAKGLVTSRPRLGTVVEPERCWNLFDTDVLRWTLGRGRPLELLRRFSELRTAIEPEAAALAALNAGATERVRIHDALARMRAVDPHMGEPLDADIAFHLAILDASGNPFFAQFRDVVATALRTSIRLTSRITRKPFEESLADHASVWDAIAARDGEAARAAMRALIADVLIEIAGAAGRTDQPQHGNRENAA